MTNHQKPPTEISFASSPEGLVSIGDVGQMQRYLMLSSSHLTDLSAVQLADDAARSSLFYAANNGLVKTTDGRLMRIRLFAWPVCMSFRSTVFVPNDLTVSGQGDTQMLLKMRELWARAFGAAEGLVISPLTYVTHLNEMLGVTPLAVRDCVRNGVGLFSGKGNAGPWRFVVNRETIESGPDMPAVYLSFAYVAWELGEAEPELKMGPQLQTSMETIMSCLFTNNKSAKVTAVAATPTSFLDAVTNGQTLFMRQLFARGMDTNRELSVSLEIEGLMIRCSAVFLHGDDVESEIEICYSDMWRPRSHLQSIQTGLLAQAEETRAASRSGIARQDFSAFKSNVRAVH